MDLKKIAFMALMIVMALLIGFQPTFAGDEGEEGDDGCDDGVSVKGQFRYRAELDGRDFNADTGPSTSAALRTRVNVMWKQMDKFGFVQLQHPYLLGNNPGSSATTPDVGPFVHQAFFGMTNCIFDNDWMYIGRMALIFGDERIIGPIDWGNGIAFDGILYGHKTDNYWAELFYTKLNERTPGPTTGPTTPVRDDAFYGVWGEYTPLKLNAFFLQRKRAAQRPTVPSNWQNNDVRNTLGIYYANKYESGLGTSLNFAYQMGTQTTLAATEAGDTDVDIAAMMYALNVWYTMQDMTMSPTFGVGIDATTGDDPTSTDKNEAYDNLYYTSHNFRGYMDFFLNGFTDPTTGNTVAGIQDIFIKAKVRPKEGCSVKLMFHIFSATEDYASAVDGSNATALGTELDLIMNHEMSKMTNMEVGLGLFNAAEEWVGKDQDSSLWAYLQLQITLGGNDDCGDCE